MNVGAFNAQLRRMGQTMLWSKGSKCPCADLSSGSPKSNCKMCRARGFLWAEPVTSRAGLSGMNVQREWAAFGQFESGDVVVSIGSDQPLYAAAEWDRVLFTQSSEGFDYIRSRGDPQEFRTFAPGGHQGVVFDRCFWLTPALDQVVEGKLPVLGSDSTLSWPDGGAPPDGVSYTLQGRRMPEYFVFGPFPRDRAHYGGQALPRRVTLRKWDLFLK